MRKGFAIVAPGVIETLASLELGVWMMLSPAVVTTMVRVNGAEGCVKWRDHNGHAKWSAAEARAVMTVAWSPR